MMIADLGDCRMTIEIADRQSQSTIVSLNRQSPLSIDNRQSPKSAIIILQSSISVILS